MSSVRKSEKKWPRGWRVHPQISSGNSALIPKGVVAQHKDNLCSPCFFFLNSSSTSPRHPEHWVPDRAGCIQNMFSFFSLVNISHKILAWHMADQLTCTFNGLPCSYLCHVTLFWSTQCERKWYLQLTGCTLHITPLLTSQNEAMMTRRITPILGYKMEKIQWQWQSKETGGMCVPNIVKPPYWFCTVYVQSVTWERSKYISSLSYCYLGLC